METVLQGIQKGIDAAIPWLVGAAAGCFLLWFTLLMREKRPFEKELKWFRGLAPLHKFIAACVVCLFAFWGGSKERGLPTPGPSDGVSSGESRVAATIQLRTLPENVASSAFSVTDFAVDSRGKEIVFEVGWAGNLFETVDSRNVDLFMSTNLAVDGWFPFGRYLMPQGTNAFSFTVSSNDIVPACRPAYVDSFGRRAFFRFGLDFDSDGDGLTDSYESFVSLTDPSNPDTDGDGMPDGWEILNGLDPLADDAAGDSDGDGLANLREYALGTSPVSVDTDGDGLTDRDEVGWWEYADAMPVFDVSGGTNLLQASRSYYADAFKVSLPFTVRCAGYVHTNMTVGVCGMVGLMSDRKSDVSFSVPSGNRNLSDWRVSSCHTAVAAYWDDLCSPANSGARMTVADVETNGLRYAVVEYANIRLYSRRNDASCVATFQIVIPEAETNTVYVHYIDLADAFDGSGATVGAQLPNREQTHLVSFDTAGAVTNGMVVAYHLGTGSNPVVADTDGDGLDDGVEAAIGTSARCADTDLDGLADAWENANGLDPLSATDGNGAEGDPDGDHLSNAKEFEYGTDPSVADTDGDGLRDGLETGSVFATNAIPWLSFDVSEDLTVEISTNRSRCVSRPTPVTLRIQGEIVTNLTISANGLVFLDRAGHANLGSAASASSFTYALDGNALVIAPYLQYAYIRSDVEGRRTSIRYGTAACGGVGYLLVEWLNAYYDTSTRKTNSISFQLAIPTNSPDRAYSRYSDVCGQYMDGRYASIGMQTFGGRGLHSWCYHSAGRVGDGLALEFLFGANSDPLIADTDGDGLADGQEVPLGLLPFQADTDGDGMNDGWEYRHGSVGFDPAVDNAADGNPDNDIDADPDGDGLTNGQECEWGTNPACADTDGDGVLDGAEIGQNSDPMDADDDGMPNARIPVPFSFGDPSSSHSEKYRLEVTPVSGVGVMPPAFSWLNENYGECETRMAMFKPGWKYEVRLRHAGTNGRGSGYPDYDYRLECALSALPPNVVLEDPATLFGTDYTSDRFAGEGKVATVTVYAVADVAVCRPDDPIWTGLEESRVVLDDEELRVRIVVVPQIQSLAHCWKYFGDTLTIKTTGTCPNGACVPIGDGALLVHSSDKSEIRISKTRQQLISFGLLPSKNDDGVDEMVWYDIGDDNPSSASNLSDSRAFAGLGYQFRGQMLKPAMGNLASIPPVSVNSESCYKSAGCEIVTVHFGGVGSACRQIMNQADYFYYSGHGRHSDGSLMGLTNGPRLTPSLVSSYWDRDLKCVVFAGCSVLDINDYNGNYVGTIEHTNSPGKLWANIKGPKSFLGYAYKAPRDTQGADRIVRAWVENRGDMGDVGAWMNANDNRNGRNACAIDCSGNFHYFKKSFWKTYSRKIVQKEDL